MIEAGRCAAVIFTAAHIRQQRPDVLVVPAPFLLVLLSNDSDEEQECWCSTMEGLRKLLETASPSYLNAHVGTDEDQAAILGLARGETRVH